MNLIVNRLESQLLITLGKGHLQVDCVGSSRDKTTETIEESWTQEQEKESNCRGSKNGLRSPGKLEILLFKLSHICSDRPF